MKKYRFLIPLSFIASWILVFVLGSIGPVQAQAGEEWTDPVNLSNSGASSNPSMVVDSKAMIHVIWVDKFDGYKYAESSDGVTWTAPVTVEFPFSPTSETRPVLLADAAGNIHIFWLDEENNLYYSKALADGLKQPSTWTERTLLSASVIGFDAMVGPTGIVHVSYMTSIGEGTDPAGVYYRRLTGSGWSVANNLYTSQYFRSLKPSGANVHVSAAQGPNGEDVYVVWDDRPQKRIYLAKSTSSGDTWEGIAQIQGPDNSSSLEFPYNINVDIVDGKPLLIWSVGIPGNSCTEYSQWAVDGGEKFVTPVKMTDTFSLCPEESKFVLQDKNYAIAQLKTQDDVALIAWNGSAWSELRPQSELSAFVNPVTFDSVLMSCQVTESKNDILYVAGCDKGAGGDIWFRSRPVGSLDEWFPPPSAWTSPAVLASVGQQVTGLTAVADPKNNIHAFWIQTPWPGTEDGEIAITYARWNGTWSEPRSIISGFNDVPSHLSVAADKQGRLLLSWVEGNNGPLYFSWANAERAGIVSEWSQPKQVPTPSSLASSPAILEDDAGRIVIAYSVPFNERRGIYLVQTENLGNDWSSPAMVMDATQAGWDSVDHPRISLSKDGRLHVLFTRYSLQGEDKAEGLYYSQSTDGGTSWTQPLVVSEKPVQWSGMAYLDDGSLNLLWQEQSRTGSAIFHQVSRDYGVTWESPASVANLPEPSVDISLISDAASRLYLIQTYIKESALRVQPLGWDGSRWTNQEQRKVTLSQDNAEYSVAGAVAAQGNLQLVMGVVYPQLIDKVGGEVLSFGRLVDAPATGQASGPVLIPTPSAATSLTPTLESQSTSTEASPLASLPGGASSSRRNLLGSILVALLLVVILLFILPGRRKTPEK